MDTANSSDSSNQKSDSEKQINSISADEEILNVDHLNYQATSLPTIQLKPTLRKNCTMCEDGNFPSAHKCRDCGKFVHIFPPCSYPLDDQEEGYGQLRLCDECFSKEQ